MIAVTVLRDSLTVLAILLIGVLTAALVGPYLIDWSAHRALIEHRLSEAAGVPVTVAGPIDLKILPTPRLDMGDVAIGDGKAGRPRLTVGQLQAVVSFTALLRGQVQVVDTILVHPRLEIAQGRDGTLDLALPSDRSADRVAIDHIGIREGTLAIALSDGRRIALDDIAVDGEAASLRGPFKVAGRVGAVPFRLATGTLDRGRFRLKLHVDAAASRPALDIDGTAAALAPAGSRPGAIGPSFEGTATLAGSLPLEGTPATVPWTMTGRLTADRDAAAATDVELRAGTDLRALIAGGEGAAAFAAGAALPTAALDLHGAAIDLDRLAVAPEDGSIAPPKGRDLLRRLTQAAGGGGGTLLPMRLDLKARFDSATLEGQTLLGPSARLGLGPEPDAAFAFSVGAPQGARLALDGRVDPGPARTVSGPFGAAPAAADPAFRGRVEVRSTDLRRSAAWLVPLSPDLAAALATLPGRSVAASGAVAASGTGVVVRGLSLTLDGSAFGGALSLTRAVGSERGRLFADLTSDALALDRLPDLSSLSTAARDIDLDLALKARAVTVADPGLDPASGRLGPIAAGNVALRLTRTGDDLRLDRLALDLDGAALAATGSRSSTEARADVTVSAPQVGPLARAFGDLLPPALAAGLRARAAVLSPLVATLRVEARGAGDALEPTGIAVTATAGGTRIEAGLTPEAVAAPSGRARPVAMTLTAAAPDGADLLRQLGIPVTATGLGPGRIEGHGRGSLEDGVVLTLDGVLGGTVLGFSGHGSAAGGGGHVTLASADLRAVLAGLGGSPDGGALPADAAGDVDWDAAVIGWRNILAHVAGVAATGDLAFDLRPPRRGPGGEPVPQIRGTLALDRLPASALFALAFGPAAAPGAGAAWSAEPFGPPPVPLPFGAVALRIGSMPLVGPLEGRQVTLGLATRPNAVSLTGMAGRLGEGSFGGALTLHRDPAGDTLSGQVTWAGIGLGVGDVSGRFGGRQDVAATGASPAALVASLSGAGTLDLGNVALARTDPAAPGALAAAIAARDAAEERAAASAEATATDADGLRRDLAARLDRGPLSLGDARIAGTLAGGVLRLGPIRTSGNAAAPKTAGAAAEPIAWSAETSAALDLGTLSLSSRAALRSRAAGQGVDGGEVVVTRAGPLAGPPRREIDVAGLLGAIQAQAIARAQERIDIIEQDIRERAAFNRQMKAIKADQDAARERAAADARARADRAKAEAQARADQARAEAQARVDQARAEAQARADQARAEAQARADQARAQAQARRAEADRAKADELRLRAEVEAAARAAAEPQRQTPPPSILQDGEGSPHPVPVPPATDP